MKLVSVVIRVYSRTDYIESAVDSALKQTYENIQVVIIDNGTNNDIENLMKQFQNNEKIVYVKTKNRGRSAALNQGVRTSTGDYVVILDDDDRIRKDMVERCMESLEQTDSLIVLTGHSVFQNSEDPKDDYQPPLKGEILKKMIWGATFPINSVLFAKSIVDSVGYIDESLDACEDYDFWLRAFSHTNKISYVDDNLAFVRIHQSNTSHDDVLMQQARLAVLKKLLDAAPDELRRAHKISSMVGFRHLITGWYLCINGQKKTGRSALLNSYKYNVIAFILGLPLLLLSSFPKDFIYTLTVFVEKLSGRRNIHRENLTK